MHPKQMTNNSSGRHVPRRAVSRMRRAVLVLGAAAAAAGGAAAAAAGSLAAATSTFGAMASGMLPGAGRCWANCASGTYCDGVTSCSDRNWAA